MTTPTASGPHGSSTKRVWRERILQEATFSPEVVNYHVLGTAIALGVTVVGIPLMPLVLPLTYCGCQIERVQEPSGWTTVSI